VNEPVPAVIEIALFAEKVNVEPSSKSPAEVISPAVAVNLVKALVVWEV